MLRSIKRLTVEYDDDSVDTYTGEGSIRVYQTYVTSMDEQFKMATATLRLNPTSKD